MTEPDPVRRLLHRWFIEYNPLYLVSAALVLAGVTLMSRGLVQDGSALGAVAVSGVAELYAWALIGGAALLTRAGLRRPAVLLSLLAVLYQGDLTLHCETATYHAVWGWLATLAWLASFAGKLFVLAAAVRVRIAPGAAAVAISGALGLALVPRLAVHAGPELAGLAAGTWLFAAAAVVLWSGPSASSRVPLDDWGQSVLRRTLRATWLVWGVLALFHLWFWDRELGVDGVVGVPLVMLFAARFLRSDLEVVFVKLVTFAVVARMSPALASMTAVFAAVAFALRASRALRRLEPESPAAPGSPYRTAEAGPAAPPAGWAFEPPPRARRIALLSYAWVALWLAVWTAGWAGGAWPEHVVAWDLLFALGFGTWCVATKSRVLWPVIAVGAVHFGVERGVISAPRSNLHWGLTSVVVGFLLLAGSLWCAVRWKARAVVVDEPPS